MPKSTEEKLDLSVSYLLLRKLIGTVGILLPIVCLLYKVQLPSISHYYYSSLTVFFTGTLVLLGMFLICNHGYRNTGEWISDHLVNIVAGIAITAVAFIPTDFQEGMKSMPVSNKDGSAGQIIHFVSASIFFLLMGLTFCFKFTRTGRDENGDRLDPSDRKKRENFWYKLMGGLILGIMLVAGILFLLAFKNKIKLPETFVFWLEVLLLIPFAIAWFVKGKAHKDVVAGAKMIQTVFTKKVK